MIYTFDTFWPAVEPSARVVVAISAWADVGQNRTLPAFDALFDYIKEGLPLQIYVYAFSDVQAALGLSGASTFTAAVSQRGTQTAPILVVSDGMAACLVITCEPVEGHTVLNELNIVSRTNLSTSVRDSVSNVIAQLAVIQSL